MTGQCIDCGKEITRYAKRCRICSNKSRKNNIPRWQRENRKEYQKTYMKTIYKEKKKESDRKYYKKLKEELFKLLGGKCITCGYSGITLEIDHVNNNGQKDNRLGPCKFIRMIKEIKSGSKDYQLLCANCNKEKELLRRGNKP